MKKLSIVFMGTPDFAVGILDGMVSAGYEVAAVVTAPDKPAGRGQKIKYSAVKEFAMAQQLPILQPVNLKDEAFLETLRSYKANLQVVVAFRMLPKVVWAMPELGTFNLHASLLPQYRGAAPINWAIINGEKKTGVTTFFIDDKIDTGAMILKAEIPIGDEENAGSLHDRLMALGRDTVLETLALISEDRAETTIQTETEPLKTAYKLDRDNCKVDWNRPGQEIHNLIRGLSPHPAAWCYFSDQGEPQAIKIYEARFSQENHTNPVGAVEATRQNLKVATQDGYIEILSLQLPGKKRMGVKELLNGMTINPGARCS